jgi:ribonuclease P protein component
MGGADRGVDTTHARDLAAQRGRFGKDRRLRKRREFLAVQETGTKFHGRHFLVVIAPREPIGHDAGRIGITVTKKIGNAVTRNRIKRLVREYARQHDWVPAGMDAVVIARRSAAELHGYADVAADLTRLGAQMQRARGASTNTGGAPSC